MPAAHGGAGRAFAQIGVAPGCAELAKHAVLIVGEAHRFDAACLVVAQQSDPGQLVAGQFHRDAAHVLQENRLVFGAHQHPGRFGQQAARARNVA